MFCLSTFRYGLPNDECASFISTLNLRESEFGGECAALERFTCHTNKMSSKYRTFDGSCNNPVRSSWGQALTGYKRLLHPRYADGIEEVGFNKMLNEYIFPEHYSYKYLIRSHKRNDLRHVLYFVK